jgi:hypothetical protein
MQCPDCEKFSLRAISDDGFEKFSKLIQKFKKN